jgi:hypothetical protein
MMDQRLQQEATLPHAVQSLRLMASSDRGIGGVLGDVGLHCSAPTIEGSTLSGALQCRNESHE